MNKFEALQNQLNGVIQNGLMSGQSMDVIAKELGNLKIEFLKNMQEGEIFTFESGSFNHNYKIYKYKAKIQAIKKDVIEILIKEHDGTIPRFIKWDDVPKVFNKILATQ